MSRVISSIMVYMKDPKSGSTTSPQLLKVFRPDIKKSSLNVTSEKEKTEACLMTNVEISMKAKMSL
ncbi:hypothetical protein DICVIV_00278 [Dictyocaulus viviparus]|uniref:Uncharacterized protein n=1 Tax=Dictyocaulus viviparus TaxID=29172 RepID=A0A0D8Y9K8_DICVI|nr:hypothetical protein DICVIV_00278 [Dictyocaulus viviparus]